MQRGGAGNIESPRLDAAATGGDDDIVPDAAKLSAHPDEAHHTGVCSFFHPMLYWAILKQLVMDEQRGGEGNVVAPETQTKNHEGLAEKLKRKLFGRKK